MAKIKAGTYRFNDVLTPCDAMVSVSFPLNFTFMLSRPSEEGLARAEEYLAPYFEQIENGELTEEEAEAIINEAMRIALENPIVFKAIADSMFIDGSYSLGWRYIVDGETNTSYVYSGPAEDSPGRWKTSYYGEGIQTITVTEDADVDNTFAKWFFANVEPNEASVKAKIQSLITKANSITGKTDTDLTEAVNSLADGYGAVLEISTEAEMNALLTTADVGSVYKYIGLTTDTYTNGGLYILEAVE